MEITITHEDMKNDYGNPFSCPLAKAVKRVFPGESVSVASGFIKFDYKKAYSYEMSKWSYSIWTAARKGGSITLELTPIN